MLNIVLFGPPGAGKGTQAENIKEHYQLIHLSTGDIFRKNISESTDLGKLAKSFIDKGELVPDEVTIQMLESEVNKFSDSNGFIFDGFPRTTQQADALDTYLHSIGTEVTKMVALNVPEEELVKRLLNRGKESGRTDDQNEDIITNRIQVYEKNTAVLADFYQAQSKLENVNGVGTVDEVTNRIFSAIDN
ncbi:MAG: adenylate kinase [Bacteroidota bacterium]|nr:adenylate kinase [Bacteroidota bacterium]